MKTLLQTTAVLLGIIFANISAQTYNDVLVVVNSNSSVSIQVGNYFKTARSIPSTNICSISCSTSEEIDSISFEQIRSSIQSYMTNNNLVNSINYIVTTKGIPLKVKRFGSTFSSQAGSSSFNSDLALIFSNYTQYIGKPSAITNPYYTSTSHFSRSSYGNIYLVTRLDGYDYNSIKGLIDRAKQPYNSGGKFVFDQDPSKASSLNTYMSTASSTLSGRGFTTLLNTTSQFVVEQSYPLGYVSWGSNDSYWSQYTQKAQPHYAWSAKALAETYVSSSGRTFTDSTYIDPAIGTWQSLISDLIHENGVTGAKGYVYEPFSSAMAHVDILFERWTKPVLNDAFNLAESYYAASPYLSWMDVIIGDPKVKFAQDGALPVQLVSFNGSVDNNTITLAWKTATEINNYGFEIQKIVNNVWTKIGFVEGNGTCNTPKSYSFTDYLVGSKNSYRLKQIDRDGSYEFSHSIDIDLKNNVSLDVHQNFPNPFNPTTTITYSLANESKVRVKIYNITGQLIKDFVTEKSQQPGTYTINWDGKSVSENIVASGVYFYNITATTIVDNITHTAIKKMTLLR